MGSAASKKKREGKTSSKATRFSHAGWKIQTATIGANLEERRREGRRSGRWGGGCVNLKSFPEGNFIANFKAGGVYK